jgi:hypothetical protein
MDTILANVESIVAALLIFNVAVSSIQKILEIIKDKTESRKDDEAYAFISKYAGYIQKAIDWVSANRPHK